MKNDVKLEDIAKPLSIDLTDLGFYLVEPKKNEVLRYEKMDSPNNFQIGLRKSPESSREVYGVILVIEYKFRDGKIRVRHPVDFRKSQTTPERMQNELRDDIDDFCNQYDTL